MTCYYTKSGQLVSSAYATANASKIMKGKSQINGYQGTDLDELPAGVFLLGVKDAPTKETEPSDEEKIGNSGGGQICVILNNKPSAVDDYNVIVFFQTAT